MESALPDSSYFLHVELRLRKCTQEGTHCSCSGCWVCCQTCHSLEWESNKYLFNIESHPLRFRDMNSGPDSKQWDPKQSIYPLLIRIGSDWQGPYNSNVLCFEDVYVHDMATKCDLLISNICCFKDTKQSQSLRCTIDWGIVLYFWLPFMATEKTSRWR